ncbi:riboflavin synthase [Lactobacillus sp. DCY120]|uniref:Riboflavin synthase n=1 Tax=Bombilactobacillus apium TaxID=2675299 RepID=A0A850R264_9LACO|nr:riboflavin synthase [Bombilactobacillus apium]NVY96111.1 riboflavin synthase [Bombilactobacillus apium]
MFTGIIQAKGKVVTLQRAEETARLEIATSLTADNQSRVGESIAVNGVCLTITNLLAGGFWTEMMPETMRRTNFASLKVGQEVDLELALAANGRLDGHFVLGHVDTTVQLVERQVEQNAVTLRFQFPAPQKPYIVEKGSLALDGVSLTVTTVVKNTFGVSLIPHTLQETVLGILKIGDWVNLETDILGKYLVAHEEVEKNEK